MGKEENKFDFREGLDKDKIIYKNTRLKWEDAIFYGLCAIITWGYGFGFLALNFYLYSNYEETVKWVYVGIWGFTVLTIIIKGGYQIRQNAVRKKEKQQILNDEKKKHDEIKRIKNDERKKSKLNHQQINDIN